MFALHVFKSPKSEYAKSGELAGCGILPNELLIMKLSPVRDQ
jgi:hypothetical protein